MSVKTNISPNVTYKVQDITSTQLDFEKLRISALSKAAEISPFVKETTIGPYSSSKQKQERTTKIIENNKDNQKCRTKHTDDLYHNRKKVIENKIHESAEDMFKNLIEKMLVRRIDTMQSYWNKQSEDCKHKALEWQALKLQLSRDIIANDNLSVLEKAKSEEKQFELIQTQTIENINKILEAQKKASARLASITDNYKSLSFTYNELVNILKTDPQAQPLCEKYLASIDSIFSYITNIMNSCQNGSVTDNEVEQAESLVKNVESLKSHILEELKLIKQQKNVQLQNKKLENNKKEEIKEKTNNENIIKQEEKEDMDHTDSAHSTDQPKTFKSAYYSENNYSYYSELQMFLIEYENRYSALLKDANYKKFRFDCQKAVNTPINALSSVNATNIKDKYVKLSTLLKGERVKVLDTFLTASQHPEGLYYCTALLAKKIVKQGDLLVSSNPEAAFPLATLAVAIWSQFPDFGKLLEAYFHKVCPYTVPMFLPQTKEQTLKEFYLSRGYEYNEEDKVETQDKFLKRMSGIFRLKCAIWVANTPTFLNEQNPHHLNHGWKWLASFINLRPEPDISATLLFEFLTVCGSKFLKVYNKQFIKILKLINTNYLDMLNKIDKGGPKTRLEVFLQNVIKSYDIPPPKGQLSLNAW